jgi:hypothetical protein
MKRLYFLTVLFLLATVTAQARVRAQCDCRHARSQQAFPLTVDFVSGGELSEMTKDSRFHPTGAYAIVWIGEGKNTVVELDGLFFSNPVKQNEVKRQTVQGTDLGGVGWALTPTRFSEAMLEGKALKSYTGQEQAGRQSSQPRVLGSTYPNGQLIEKVRTYYYPNGQIVNDVAGLRYHHGKPRMVQGRHYYPNGQQVSSQGQFFYPNGKRLTQGSSAGTDIQYLADDGAKLNRAPAYITVKEGDWTYYFGVYNGQVITDEFQVDWNSPDGIINLQIDGAEIVQASVR